MPGIMACVMEASDTEIPKYAHVLYKDRTS